LKLSETGKILFEQLELKKSFMQKCDFSMQSVFPECNTMLTNKCIITICSSISMSF